MAKKNVKLGAALFLDSYQKEDSSGFKTKGIVNSFRVWGFPSTRHVTAALTAFNVPDGGFTLGYSLKKKGVRKATETQNFEIECAAIDSTSIIVPMNLEFEAEGEYELLFTVEGQSGTLKVPFIVSEQAWPNIDEQIAEFDTLPAERKPSIHAKISCENCGEKYSHYLYMGAEQDGYPPFPEEGVFECGQCGSEVHTRDLEGRLRLLLMKKVSEEIRKAA